MAHADYRTKGTLLLSSTLLFFSVAANARTCLKVDDEGHSPAVTVSGRVTTQHRLPKGSELRAGDGPWLILDQPLLADPLPNFPVEGGCREWRKITILSDDKLGLSDDKLGRWVNKHVTIDGKLGRFTSALVDPAIYIEVTTIKKD
jgi:hypothetical protein